MTQNFTFDNNEATILIVDDQPFNIRILEEILKKENYKSEIATNAAQAYKVIQKIIPDLILLDVMMPGEDGFEFCGHLKDNPKTKEIPVIFLTAKVEPEDKIKGFKLGAVDYITKPFNATEVLARVNTHVQFKKARDFIRNYNTQLESIIEQRTQELIKSEKQAVFGQLIQGIIHNIRGPIASVISSFQLVNFYREDMEELLKDKPDLLKLINENCKEIWNVLEHDEKMLIKLIKSVDAMMVKSRSDRSKVIEVIDLNEILRGEIEFLNADMFFNKIQKDISLSESPLKIKVIPGEIAQIFNNLVKNSLDAMYDKKDCIISIATGCSDKYCWFTVKDNGSGIPGNIIERIFDPFFTTKSMRKEDNSEAPTGTGIGLHFSKQTAESYGGKIEVQSKEGEGAKFIVSIPLS